MQVEALAPDLCIRPVASTPTPPGPWLLGHFDLPAVFAEWAQLAQGRAEWINILPFPLRDRKALRAATTGRGQGDSRGQALGGCAAFSQGRRAAGGPRRHQQQLGS